MKFMVSDKDKRMLLLLAAFFAALAYYYLIFSPLHTLSVKTGKELISKNALLNIKQAKIHQFKSWQDGHERLAAQTARIYKMINAPFTDRPDSERMDAVMNAATKAGVKVEALKPVASSIQTPGQESKTLINQFIVDGKCSFMSFLKFMRELYGMKINQFTLSADDKNHQELRFYMVLESLPQLPPKPPGLDKLKITVEDYRMDNSLFVIKHAPASPKETQDQPQKHERMEPSISGLKLNGIARVDSVDIAIISDSEDRNASFRCYHINDRVRGIGIVAIKENEVRLMADDQTPYVLRFSDNAAPSPAAEPAPQAAPAKSRLGLRVCDLEPAYAEKIGFQGTAGLLVLESKPGRDIMPDDVIVSIAGKNVSSTKDALKIAEGLQSGDMVQLVFFRKDKELKTSIKFD